MAQVSAYNMKPGDIFTFQGRRFVYLGHDNRRIRMIEPSEIATFLEGKRSRGGGIRITKQSRTPHMVDVIGKHPHSQITRLLGMVKEKREAQYERISEIRENVSYSYDGPYRETFKLSNGDVVGLGDTVEVQFRNGVYDCLIVGQGRGPNGHRPDCRRLVDEHGRIGILDIRYGDYRSRPQYLGAEYILRLVKKGTLENNEIFKRVMEHQENVADKRSNTRARRDFLRKQFGL